MERAGLVVLLLATLAGAHTLQFPKRDRLVLSAAQVRVGVDYSVTAEDARALRQILKKPITDYLVQQATHFLALTVDGVARPLQVTQITPFDEGVHVELSATVEKPRHLHFEDRHKDRRITVPVEVVLKGVELARPLLPQSFVFADHALEVDLK